MEVESSKKKLLLEMESLMLLLTLIMPTLAFTAHNVIAQAQEEIPYGGTLRIGWAQEPESLNPLICGTIQGYAILRPLVYDSLLSYDTELEPAAKIAQSWELSADNETWTFQLATNVTWQDGNPLRASDVKFTYDYLKGLGTAAGYLAPYVEYVESVEASDAYTVVIKTDGPITSMLYDVIHLPILPEQVWSSWTAANVSEFTNVPALGSGPYKLVDWKIGEYIELEAYEDYWRGRPYLDKIYFQYFSARETMVQSLQAGTIHVIPWEVPPTLMKMLGEDPDIKTVTAPNLYFREISINVADFGTQNPTLRDRNVRQALSMAVDKDFLVSSIHLGYAEAGTSIVHKANPYWFNSTIEPFEYNLTVASQLLTDSGYVDIDDDGVRESPNGTKLEYTLLVLNRWPEELRAAEIIQGWWSDIGVKLNLQVADGPTICSYIYPEYSQDMFLWGYSGTPDPSSILRVMYSPQIQNWNDCGYNNSRYDELYDEQLTAMDPVKRKEIVNEMQGIVHFDAPYIVLYYTDATAAYRTDEFTGFVNMPCGIVSYLNYHTFVNVHLIRAPPTTPAPSILPWIIAAICIVVAVVSVVVAISMRRKATSE